ncbi:MAG: isopentenyl phosphate kinase family protein [Thermoplasmata archaeon]|nr:MAG: isopentenyl phosphate kinase family protein [Thermoplasmata archaeon]
MGVGFRMFIIKFGGSVITDKKQKYTFERSTILRLISEIKEAQKRTLVVHGAGSFGHIMAKEYELHKGYKNEGQIQAAAGVQKDVKHLNLMVLDSFLEIGISAVSLAPSSFVINENGKIKSMDMGSFKRYFDMGFTPITFGDVVLDDAISFSICSGDQLMLELARTFLPEKAIFVADIDGIFSSAPQSDESPKLLPTIDEDIFLSIKKSDSHVDDVTGSIYGKLEIMFEIASLGLETIILNGRVENRLKEALQGKDIVCTKIESRH